MKTPNKLKALIKAERRRVKLNGNYKGEQKMVRTRTEGQRLADLLEILQKYEECKAVLDEELSNETVSKQYTYEKCPSKRCKNPFEKCFIRAEQKRIRRQREAEVLQHLQNIERIKADLGDEICDETGYGQNLNCKPCKQYTNPFKKYGINRQIKAEKKRAQCKREAEELKQLQDIERAKSESARAELARAELARAKFAKAGVCNLELCKKFGYKQCRCRKPPKRYTNPFKKPVYEETPDTEICKLKRVKKGKKVKKTKLPHEYYRDNYEICEPERVNKIKKTNPPSEYYRNDYEICEPKRVKKIKKTKLPCTFHRDDYEICEPERVTKNKKTKLPCEHHRKRYEICKPKRVKKTKKTRLPCEYYNDDYEICKPNRIEKIKRTKLPCEYYRGDYEIYEPKIVRKITKIKLKRKKKPLIKCTNEDNDKICEANANTPMIFNNKRCKHLYCFNKQQELECVITRKLRRKENKILQKQLCVTVEQRYFKKIMNEYHYPTAGHG